MFFFNLFNSKKISIGIMTNLFTFPPSFLLIQMFKRSKRNFRTTSQPNLKKEFIRVDSKIHKNNNSKPFKFPWWFKIIAYIVSLVSMILCSVFIIFKGILK